MSLRGLALLGLASLAVAAPSASTVNKRYVEERNGVSYNVFKRAGETSSLSYVKNSGICETTPGVDQYSGYLDVGTDSKQLLDTIFTPSRRNLSQLSSVACASKNLSNA